MKRIASGLVAAAAVVALAGPAMAQPSLDFHMSTPTFNCGAIGTSVAGCGDIDPNYNVGQSQATIVLGGALGGVAVQFGIDYSSSPGTVIAVASNCNPAYQTIALGAWPASGTGAAIAFGGCVNGVTPDALIPIQYLFFANVVAAGTMQFIPDPSEGAIKYVNCDDLTIDIGATGIVDFAGAAGSFACMGPVPTEEKSWGQIKALF